MALKFNQSDFEEVFYSCVVLNQTSQIDCLKYKKIKIEEFLNTGIRLLVPTKICQKGHILMLVFFKGRKPRIPKKMPISGEGKGIRYSAIGKVMDKAESQFYEGRSRIEINFTQFDKHGWTEFLGEYTERQESINNLFSQISLNKGSDES